MSHTVTDLGLQGYKAWRTSLNALPNGTVIKFINGYRTGARTNSITPNQELMIVSTGIGCLNHDVVYKMVIHRNGKLFRKVMYFSVESIARWLIDGDCEVVK